MWIFSKDQGFFSAVSKDTIRKDEIMVRGRCYQDLQRLIEVTGLNTKILIDPYADYLFRVIVPRDKWAEYLYSAAMAIDYDNFKDASCHDDERYRAYSGVWLELKMWENSSTLAQRIRSLINIK